MSLAFRRALNLSLNSRYAPKAYILYTLMHLAKHYQQAVIMDSIGLWVKSSML